jgi:hypothetical protein
VSKFTESIGDLYISPVGDGRTFILKNEFSFYLCKKRGDIITVPSGFHTDGASIPLIFRWLLPRWGKYGKAAILHDYLYRAKFKSRKDSDLIMLRAMSVLKVCKWQKTAIYNTLRMFGWFGWYKLNSTQGWKNMYKDKFRQVL